MTARTLGALRHGLPCLLLLLGALAAVPAHAVAPAEQARNDYHIASNQGMREARFIRNGTSYDAAAAAQHLRRKLKLGGAHIRTAEDFIRECATRSSVSGEPYQIRLADGHTVLSAEFLQEKLAEFDRRAATEQ